MLDIRPLLGVFLKHFSAQDAVFHWNGTRVRSRATATTATDFLDEVVGCMPFPAKAIEVDGGPEFMAEFEVARSQRHIRLFICHRTA